MTDSSPRHVLVIGASRGLGLEHARQYAADGARVVGTVRDDAGRERLEAVGATAHVVDVRDPASVAGLAWKLDGEAFDIVIVNAGVYGPRTTGIEAPSEIDFDAVMHTNVLGPMRVLPAVADALAPGARVVVISSSMGSIGLRTNPTGWLYRASKAAVNSITKDVSIAWGARATCIAMHPGWVRTDMGGAEADLEVPDAVASMRQTIASLTHERTGCFLSFDGEPLDW